MISLNKYFGLYHIYMAPEGFEPPTTRLRGECSNQTELRSQLRNHKIYVFKTLFLLHSVKLV